MLRPKKMKLWKKAALSIAVLALLGVIAYLVYTNFINPEHKRVIDITKALGGDVTLIPGLNSKLADDFLTKQPYIKLKQHGILPITIIKLGRTNPFQEIIFFSNE